VLSLPARDFFALTDANSRLARGLLLGLTWRLMELTRRLAERSARAELRVARLLLTLSERLGRSGEDGNRLPLALTRQQVAGLVGFTQWTA
jgi:CRP-like cAMP-binding protein